LGCVSVTIRGRTQLSSPDRNPPVIGPQPRHGTIHCKVRTRPGRPTDGGVAPAGDPNETLVLRPEGCLDDDAGQALVVATREVVGRRAARVEIVLDGIESFTEGGIAALSACARLHDQVAGGVGLLASGGAGRAALLAACRPDSAG
jgi:hypothetical protein